MCPRLLLSRALAATFAGFVFIRPVCADNLGDLVASMDKRSPKYATAGCTMARDEAVAFSAKAGQQVVVTALLSPTFLGLLYLSGQQKEAQQVGRDLMGNCGYDAFLPYFRPLAEGGDEQSPSVACPKPLPTKSAEHGASRLLVREGGRSGQRRGGSQSRRDIPWRTGVPKDIGKAVALWTAAAKEHSPEARTNLASLYIEGKDAPGLCAGGGPLTGRGLQGHASAQALLASLYEQGHGVKANAVTAYMLYDMAATNGDQHAASKRDALAATIGEDDAHRAHVLAVHCRNSNYLEWCRF